MERARKGEIERDDGQRRDRENRGRERDAVYVYMADT